MINNNYNINNKEYYDFYNKYKHIMSGMRTIEDCYLIMEKSNLTIINKKILLSMIEGKKIEKCIDYILMKEIVRDLYNYKYREEAYAQIPLIMNKTNNLAQIKTFTRIANSKPLKPPFISIREINTNVSNISKPCPHCSHICTAPKFSEYIICGFGNNGYDWEGCGKDWCFKCGKILCKSWENDMLFIEENRCHNMECCKHHAHSNNKTYPDDYCQCNNDYVKRNTV